MATDDPEINVSRVANRVALKGHDVPSEKIISRYYKSLELLIEAIRHTNRAYIFDNSTNNAEGTHTWLAEITDGRILELKTPQAPAWFKHAVLDKISPTPEHGPAGSGRAACQRQPAGQDERERTRQN